MGNGETGAGKGTAKRLRVTVLAAVAAMVAATGGFLLTDGFAKQPGAGGGGKGGEQRQVYDRHHTRVTVGSGDRFALKLPENASTGYAWTVKHPKPDPRVVRQTGKRRKGKDPERMGAGATLYLDYRAGRPGHSRIRLRYCFLCATSHGDPHRPDHKPVELTYDVTVER